MTAARAAWRWLLAPVPRPPRRISVLAFAAFLAWHAEITRWVALIPGWFDWALQGAILILIAAATFLYGRAWVKGRPGRQSRRAAR